MGTKINWCDETINPLTTTEGGWFCFKSSPGCLNCYAEKINLRFGNRRYYSKNQGETNPPEFLLNRYPLNKIKHWTKPKKIFVQSMSDLFLPGYEYINDGDLKRSWFEGLRQIWLAIRHYEQHTFIILTKHPNRLLDFYNWSINKYPDYGFNYNNLWLGVSVESQEQADKRIPILLQIPAAVRFVSCEPLLSSLDLSEYLPHYKYNPTEYKISPALSWVICGTENLGGRPGRSVSIDAIRNLKNQCVDADVPFFLKQMPILGMKNGLNVKLLQKMPALDGRQWNEFPEVEL